MPPTFGLMACPPADASSAAIRLDLPARLIPASVGARRFSRDAQLKLVERKDAEEKNYDTYALGTNAMSKERRQIGANVRAKR